MLKILADHHMPYVQDYFGGVGELILKPGRMIHAADVKEIDMLLVRSVTRVDENLLRDSRVRWVGSLTSGHDHLDVAWLNEKGITWHTASGFNAPPVSDYVMAVLAAFAERGMLPQMGFRVAIIGVGHIGKHVSQRLQCLGCEVLLCDPFRQAAENHFPHVPIDAISDVDVITLHVPLMHAGKYPTYHLIDHTFLKRQKKNCILINTSRGTVVHSADFLKSKEIIAAFDVWAHEPHIDPQMLARVDIATPHIAGYSLEAKRRGMQIIYEYALNDGLLEKKPALTFEPIKHIVTLNDNCTTWQSAILSTWNPLHLSNIIKATPTHLIKETFDDLRKTYKRHEFSAITLEGGTLSAKDRYILTQLGFKFV